MYLFPNPAIEGWIIIITGLHEESQEDDIYDVFSKYGQIKGIHLNMDRKTGYAKGYALIEYESQEEADAAIKEMNGEEIYDKKIVVDWAFREKPIDTGKALWRHSYTRYSFFNILFKPQLFISFGLYTPAS